MKENMNNRRKIAMTVIVIVIFVGLLVAARFLVINFDMLELIKKLHGG